GAGETSQSVFQVEEKRIALLFAVVSNVDASFRLFRHNGANSVKTSSSDFLGVNTLAESAPHEQASQVLWSRQAASMCGQNSVSTTTHHDSFAIDRRRRNHAPPSPVPKGSIYLSRPVFT